MQPGVEGKSGGTMYAKWDSKPLIRKRWTKCWVSWHGDTQEKQEAPREKMRGYKTHTNLSDNLAINFSAGRCGLAEMKHGKLPKVLNSYTGPDRKNLKGIC